MDKFGKHCVSEIWKVVPFFVMWFIWRERKARVFEGCETSLVKLKSTCLRALYDWMAGHTYLSCSN